MAKRRPNKEDHLIPVDICDSRAKAGVWFGEKRGWKTLQNAVLEKFKDEANWVDVKKAILVISEKPEGVVLVAPNPALPGIMVFANGTTASTTERLYKIYTKKIAELAQEAGTETLIGQPRKP